MLLICLVGILVVSIPALVMVQRRNPLGRPAVIAYLGLDIAMLGIVLTPGIAWGDFDNHSAIRPISTLVFYIGVGVLIWSAVAWRRTRSRTQPKSN